MIHITKTEAVEMMKAKLECMTRDISGGDQDCNAKNCDECALCYAHGNMGEQKEWLRIGIESLEKETKTSEELLMKFIHFLVAEECEGCTDCNPFTDKAHCYIEGRAKWYVDKIKEFKEDKQ